MSNERESRQSTPQRQSAMQLAILPSRPFQPTIRQNKVSMTDANADSGIVDTLNEHTNNVRDSSDSKANLQNEVTDDSLLDTSVICPKPPSQLSTTIPSEEAFQSQINSCSTPQRGHSIRTQEILQQAGASPAMSEEMRKAIMDNDVRIESDDENSESEKEKVETPEKADKTLVESTEEDMEKTPEETDKTLMDSTEEVVEKTPEETINDEIIENADDDPMNGSDLLPQDGDEQWDSEITHTSAAEDMHLDETQFMASQRDNLDGNGNKTQDALDFVDEDGAPHKKESKKKAVKRRAPKIVLTEETDKRKKLSGVVRMKKNVDNDEEEQEPRRSAKRVSNAHSRIEKMRQTVEALVETNIKSAGFYFNKDSSLYVQSAETESIEDKTKRLSEELRVSNAIKAASVKYESAIRNEREHGGPRGEKVKEVEREYQDEIRAAKQSYLSNLNFRMKYVNISDCGISSMYTDEVDELTVLETQQMILARKKDTSRLVITAAQVGDKFLVVDPESVNLVEAFKALGKSLHEKHCEYKTVDVHPNPRRSSSQTEMASSDYHGTEVLSSQPSTESERENFYGKILANVIMSAPPELGTEYCALHKASMQAKEKDLSAISKAIRLRTLAARFNLDKPNGMKSSVHDEKLKLYDIYCTPNELRGLRTMSANIELVIQNMLKMPCNRRSRLNTSAFLQKFVAARKISCDSADRVIHILNGTIAIENYRAEDALETLTAHSTEVKYLFMGKMVREDHAEALQEQLEPGPQTFRCVREHIQDGRRLSFESLQKKRDKNPDSFAPILLELERLMKPFAIGFVKPTVIFKEVNDGSGREQERCILNIIDMDDLQLHPQKFHDAIKDDETSLFFVVSSSKGRQNCFNNEVTSYVVGAGVISLSIIVDQITKNEKGEPIRESLAYPAVMMGGDRETAWQNVQLLRLLKQFQISNTINNEQIRRLMYDLKNPGEEPAPANKYNSIFVHSTTPVVVDVVASVALNRVFTSASAASLDSFKGSLTAVQREKTRYGKTISAAPQQLRDLCAAKKTKRNGRNKSQ